MADCFFCLLYELPVTASIVCGSSRRDADLFPASFASANLRTCSNVISWFLSPSRSTTIIFNPPPPPLPPSLPDLWPLHSYWSSLSLVPTPSPQQYTEQQKSHLPKQKEEEEEEEDKEKEEEVEKEEWVESMVVRSYIDFLIYTTYPYSSCICSILQQHPYFLFIFKCFSFLFQYFFVIIFYVLNNFFTQYKHTYWQLRASHGSHMKAAHTVLYMKHTQTYASYPAMDISCISVV